MIKNLPQHLQDPKEGQVQVSGQGCEQAFKHKTFSDFDRENAWLI